MKKYSFSDRTQGSLIWFLQETKSILEKDKKSVVWDQISEIWPQKGRPGNPDSDEQYCELYNGNIA